MMRTYHCILALIVIGTALPGTSKAQFARFSLRKVFELNVAEADGVVCATVERLEALKDGSNAIATISVDRHLKGQCPDRFFIETSGDDLQLRHRYLFCLANSRPINGPLSAPFTTVGYPVVGLFDPPEDQNSSSRTDEILTIDGWRPWNDIERIAAEVCADPATRSGVVGIVGDGRLAYPTIARTEQHFIRMAASEEPRERVIAVAVLREFNTPQSIRVLQGLVSDPLNIDTGSGASHTRYYTVRAAAREALDRLNAPIPAERVEDALVEYEPLSAHWRVPAVILPILLGLLCVIWRFSLQHYRKSITIGVAFILASLALGLLWTRSSRTGDEWVFSYDSRIRVATYDGLLQVAVIRQWPDHREALWGSFPANHDSAANSKTRFPWWTDENWGQPVATLVRRRLYSNMPQPFVPSELERQRTISRSIQKYGVSIASGQAGDSMGGMQPFSMVRLPIAYLIALMTFVPVAQLVMLARRQVRRMQRRRRGQCVRCGYDLRASIGRCPECGAMAPVVPARANQLFLKYCE